MPPVTADCSDRLAFEGLHVKLGRVISTATNYQIHFYRDQLPNWDRLYLPTYLTSLPPYLPPYLLPCLLVPTTTGHLG